MIKLRNIFIGIFSSFILVSNTLILAVLMIPLGVIKFLIPLKTLRASFTRIIIKIGELWIDVNSSWVIYLHKPNIEITGEENLNANDFLEELNNFEVMIEEIENEALYFGEYDDLNAVITINAGAGGVDAHDWAEILLRMYTRFLSSQNMKYQIEEISQGEEGDKISLN